MGPIHFIFRVHRLHFLYTKKQSRFDHFFCPANRKLSSSLWYELPSKFCSSWTSGRFRWSFSLFLTLCWEVLTSILKGGRHLTSVTFTVICSWSWFFCTVGEKSVGEGRFGNETYGPILSTTVNLQVVQITWPNKLFHRRQFLFTFSWCEVFEDLDVFDFEHFLSKQKDCKSGWFS